MLTHGLSYLQHVKSIKRVHEIMFTNIFSVNLRLKHHVHKYAKYSYVYLAYLLNLICKQTGVHNLRFVKIRIFAKSTYTEQIFIWKRSPGDLNNEEHTSKTREHIVFTLIKSKRVRVPWVICRHIKQVLGKKKGTSKDDVAFSWNSRNGAVVCHAISK